MNPLETSLGRAIQVQRERRGFTQFCLARRSGVSRNGIAQIERGRHAPHLASLRRIAEAMDMRLWQLLQFAERLEQLHDAPFDVHDAALLAARKAA